MTYAPILLFVYNRPDKAEDAIESLAVCDEASKSKLFIFSDGPKNDSQIKKVNEVREKIEKVSKNKFESVEIIKSEENKGLAKSIITGVSEIINKYKSVIVVEDDAIVTKNFLSYMNSCLAVYEDDNRVWSIGAYLVPIQIEKEGRSDVFLCNRGSSCAWASWSDRWNKIDWDDRRFYRIKYNPIKQILFNTGGNDLAIMLVRQLDHRIDSWAIRFAYSRFLNHQYWVLPYVSKVFNSGCDGTGTHNKATDKYDNIQLDNGYDKLSIEVVEYDKKANHMMKKFHDLSFVELLKMYYKTYILKR